MRSIATGKSRTKLSILNSKISLIYYFIGLALEFVSRRVFIHTLGSEVVGLNTTAVNLLGFLNLAELGIGTAVAVTLYKPLYDNNYNSVNDIVTLQGYLYKRISWVVLCGGIVLMLFFPIIFRNISLPLWYAYASFGVLLYGALLTYTYNYKQIILSADQKNYQILFSYKTVLLVGTIAQIILLKLLSHGYIWWLVIQFIFPTIASISLSKCIKKEYPEIQKSRKSFRRLRMLYPIVVTKIKQVFFHRIASYILLQSSPLILFFFSDLTVVTIYGNYMIICTGLIRLLGAIFSSMAASIGNLIAEKNTDKVYLIFEEIFSARFLFVTTLCFVLYYVADTIITLWVGPEFILDKTLLALIVIYLFQNANRTTVDNFLQGYGLYGDIWAPIIEAILNLGLSILLGLKFGLLGILIAINISLIVIVGIWKPYFLYKRGFKFQILKYIKLYTLHIFCATCAWLFCAVSYNYIFYQTKISVSSLLIECAFSFISFYSIVFCLSYFIAPGQRNFCNHIYSYLFRKHK